MSKQKLKSAQQNKLNEGIELTGEELLAEFEEMWQSATIGDTWKLNERAKQAYNQLVKMIEDSKPREVDEKTRDVFETMFIWAIAEADEAYGDSVCGLELKQDMRNAYHCIKQLLTSQPRKAKEGSDE